MAIHQSKNAIQNEVIHIKKNKKEHKKKNKEKKKKKEDDESYIVSCFWGDKYDWISPENWTQVNESKKNEDKWYAITVQAKVTLTLWRDWERAGSI